MTASLVHDHPEPLGKLRLIFLLPSLAGGGAERVASTLMKSLREHFDLTLALLENRRIFPVPETVQVIIFSGSLSGRASHIVRMPFHLLRLVRLIKKRRVGVVMSFMEQANILNILSSFATHHHSVIVQHASRRQQYAREKHLIYSLMFWTSRWLYPKAARVIAVSEGIRQILISDYGIEPQKVTVISNPIDCQALAEQAAQDPPFSLPQQFLLHVGRLKLETKAQDALLAAFSTLRKRHPDLSLVLIGDGPDKKKIENLIRSHNLENYVILAGWQPNVAALMARAEALILCSRYEGWPMVLVEAMACGCPVISTDCLTGPREILGDNEFGLLVPADDPGALARAVQRLMGEHLLHDHYKKQGLQRAKDFDLVNIDARYNSLLKTL